MLKELRCCSKDSPFIAQDYAESVGAKEVNVRSAIRQLRLQGYRICSDTKQRGYWFDANGGGYEATREQMLKRAYKILEVVEAMDGERNEDATD